MTMWFTRIFVTILFISFFDRSPFFYAAGQGVPASPCPNIFHYYQEPNGNIYGGISLPYDGSTSLSLGVNASLKGYYTSNDKVSLKIKLNTPSQDLIQQRAKTLDYSVYFPFQHTIPKITYIDLNNRGYCSGPPEELIPGEPGVTSLWAGHKYYFQTTNRNGGFEPVQPVFPIDNTVQHTTTSERYPEVVFTPPSLPPKQPFGNTIDLPTSSNNNQNQGCGITRGVVPLILGGNEITDGEFPWLAAMFTARGTGYEYKCTANLVSDKHVVTAARCVNYYKVQIIQTKDILFVFGKSNLQNWATHGAVTRGAASVLTNPEFNQTSGHADVTVITLDRTLQFSNTISPICLWSGNDDLSNIVNKMGTVAGWGADEKSQKSGHFSVSVARSLDMPVVSQDQCLFSNLSYYSLTSDMTFCAGQRDGSGTCVGDNGAGFMINMKGKFYLRGLSSMTLNDDNGKCDLSFFMIFCDVAKFANWIKTAME